MHACVKVLGDCNRSAHVAMRAAPIVERTAAAKRQAGRLTPAEQPGVKGVAAVVPCAVARAVFVNPCDRVPRRNCQIFRRKRHVLDRDGMRCLRAGGGGQNRQRANSGGNTQESATGCRCSILLSKSVLQHWRINQATGRMVFRFHIRAILFAVVRLFQTVEFNCAKTSARLSPKISKAWSRVRAVRSNIVEEFA